MAFAAAATLGAFGLGTVGTTAALAADDCANAEFRTGWSAKLPDCRAYELVSPAEKNGVPLGPVGAKFPLPARDAFYFAGLLPMAGANPVDGQGELLSALVRRTDRGWQTKDIWPRTCSPFVHGKTSHTFVQGSVVADDLQTSLVRQNTGTRHCDDPDDQAGLDIYLQDLSDRSLTWISQNGTPKTANANVLFANGSLDDATASRDLRHVFFTTTEKLVPSADAGRVASASGLYERVDRQITRAVDVDDAGVELSRCGVPTWNLNGSAVPVSTDGRVAFFATATSGDPTCTVANGGGRLYARIDGARTVAVTPAPTTAAPRFMGATPDGRFAFFTSKEQLTSGSTPGGGLYRADLSRALDGESVAPTLTFLTPQTAVPAGPAIDDRLQFTDDGQIVYFVASNAPLVAGATSSSHTYRYADGALTDLGPTGGSIGTTQGMSADGSKIVFGRTVDSTTQLFLSDRGGTPVCVSCPRSGPSTGHSKLDADDRPGFYGRRRHVTNDGRVFFQTRNRLVVRDQNAVDDVYEWAAGEHRLLSSGTSAQPSLLLGVSGEGRDVFFLTTDSLVAQDFDNGDGDIYTARIDGGFPAPPAPPRPCTGDECQGASAEGSLPGGVPATVALRGSGNLLAQPSVAAPVGRVRVARVPVVRGASGRARVWVPAAGQVRVSGSGLRRSYVRAKKASTVRVPVRLSARAQRRLRSGGRVRVRATVRFTPARGTRSTARVTVTFRQKQSTKKAGR